MIRRVCKAKTDTMNGSWDGGDYAMCWKGRTCDVRHLPKVKDAIIRFQQSLVTDVLFSFQIPYGTEEIQQDLFMPIPLIS